MSEIADELERITNVCDRPTLTLLDRRRGPLALAIFRCSFGSRRARVNADQLHTQVDAYLAELRAVGADVPEGTGRSLCVGWMRQQWLYRTADADGVEEYSMTADALESLALVESLNRARPLLSESRLNTILTVVRRAATLTNTDTETRLARLDTDIAALTAERDRIAAGGELTGATDDQMLGEYSNLVDLVDQLPGDFARVGEAMAEMRQRILAALRAETAPLGAVIDDYLASSDQLMAATPEGQAFEGARAVLTSEAFLDDLHTDLNTLLDQPAAAALTDAERAGLADTVHTIRDGYADVVALRAKLSATLREHIVHHDPTTSREVEKLLRELQTEMTTFFANARPRTPLAASLAAGVLDIDYLHERTFDDAEAVPPPPLHVETDDPQNVDVLEILAQGGPRLDDVRASLPGVAGDGPEATAAAAFNRLATTLRRPVEILGLLHLAGQADAPVLEAQTDMYATLDPDGRTGTFRAPAVRLTRTDAHAISGRADLGQEEP